MITLHGDSMNEIKTVGDLRRLIEGLPDDKPVLSYEGDFVFAYPVNNSCAVPLELMFEQDNEE